VTTARDLDEILRNSGYEPFGGISTRVYRSREHGEVLKLALWREPEERDDLFESFRRCHASSDVYAAEG
jgi:hypothetical protein